MIEQVLAGRYQILNPMSFSNASKLLKAQDLTLNRLVSVLPWPTDVDPQTIETFANLNEPGVIHVLDVFNCEGQYYVVSTEVKGEPLSSFCTRRELSPQIAANIVLSLALAVEVIHRKGWAVTSIKTQDIYLDEESNPTITYARLWRSDRDTDSIEAIIQVLQEMLAFIDPNQLNEASSIYLESLGEFAGRAVTSRGDATSYVRFDEFINDLKQLYKNFPVPTPAAVNQNSVDQDTKPIETVLRKSSLPNAQLIPDEQPPRSMTLPARSTEKAVRPLHARRLFAIGAISAALLLVAGAGLWSWRSSAAQTSMPDLHGKTADQANLQLQKLGWHGHVVVSKTASSAAQDGSIVEERPDAGSKIALSQTIYLTVANQASDPNAMAAFTGQDASLIYAKLIQTGVPASNITLKSQPSSNSAGMVISQSPTAGAHFDPQTTPIELDIAVPAGSAVVPSVLNQNVDAAGQLLIQNGLHYHYTIDRSGGTPGTVADQDIPPGRVVPNGSNVELHVVRK